MKLETPTLEAIRSLRSNIEAHHEAAAAIRTARRIIDAMRPVTLAAIAVQRYPNATVTEAVAQLASELLEIEGEIIGHAAEADEVWQAEMSRIKPTATKAIARLFEVKNEITSLNNVIEQAAINRRSRVKKMIEAGLSEDEAEAVVPKLDTHGDETKLLELRNDHRALERFAKTYDPSDLPGAIPEAY